MAQDTHPLMRIILRKDALDFVYRRRQLDYFPPFQRCKSGARQMVTFGGLESLEAFYLVLLFWVFSFLCSLLVFSDYVLSIRFFPFSFSVIFFYEDYF